MAVPLSHLPTATIIWEPLWELGVQVGDYGPPVKPKTEESHLEKWLHTRMAASQPWSWLQTRKQSCSLVDLTIASVVLGPASAICLCRIWLQLLSTMVWDQSGLLRTQQEIHFSSVSREAGLLTLVLAVDPEGAL